MTIVRKFFVLASSTLLLAVLSVAAAPAAAADVNGSVACSHGDPVTGVYINRVSGPGTSGFATRTGSGDYQFYNRTGVGATTRWYPSIGCGVGSTAGSWKHTLYGPTVTGSASFTCFTGYSSSFGGTNRCVPS